VPPDLRCGAWQATSRQMTPPLAERRPPGFLRPGVAWRFHRADPHHDDRSSQWIYPNLTDPSTSLSRVRVESRLEKRRNSTALRCGPRYRTNPPGVPRLRSAHLVGPLSALSRERQREQPHPRCLPPTKLLPPVRAGGAEPPSHVLRRKRRLRRLFNQLPRRS